MIFILCFVKVFGCRLVDGRRNVFSVCVCVCVRARVSLHKKIRTVEYYAKIFFVLRILTVSVE